jgi:hypothetical protein
MHTAYLWTYVSQYNNDVFTAVCVVVSPFHLAAHLKIVKLLTMRSS